MRFPQLTIRPRDDDAETKGRSFSVYEVATIFAPGVIPDGSGTVRPVLLAYAGTPSAVRAFTANLRTGETAETTRHRIELLRSHGYRYQVLTPAPGQALVIAYLPDLFHLQPGALDQGRVRFLSALPSWWLDRQEALLEPEFGEHARDHARAMAFVARLDARSPLPIANDPGFHYRLYQRACEEPWVTRVDDEPSVLSGSGLDRLGLDPPLLCHVPQDTFAEFLAEATAELMDVAGEPATARPQSPQLAFAF